MGTCDYRTRAAVPGRTATRRPGAGNALRDLALVPTERRNLTDQVTPHDEDDGLFRTPGQADEQPAASDVTNVKPLMQPSRDLFHHTIKHEADRRQRPTTQRDEAAMRSLRFPFDEDGCQ